MGTTSKSVWPDGTEIYVKSGSTEVKIASSTGGLYHQGTILPVSPVGSTVSATLEHKSLAKGTAFAVTAMTTATENLPGYGLCTFNPTTATQSYTLELPTTGGIPLWLYDIAGSSNDTITIATTAANLINGGYKTLVLNASAQMVKLVAVSTAAGWAVESFGSTVVTTKTTSLPGLTS